MNFRTQIEEILDRFREYLSEPNPEGKTELVDYNRFTTEIIDVVVKKCEEMERQVELGNRKGLFLSTEMDKSNCADAGYLQALTDLKESLTNTI